MSSTKVVTGLVTFCYVNVFEPAAREPGEALKYSAAILIDKDDKKTLNAVNDAIEAAYNLGVEKGMIPKSKKLANIKTPLRDGDDEKPDDHAFENKMFFNASGNNKPGIVDENVAPIIDREEFYSGVIGRASINFYPFATKGNIGVAAGLNNVQKMKDGERLGGGSASAAADFGAPDDDGMLD